MMGYLKIALVLGLLACLYQGRQAQVCTPVSPSDADSNLPPIYTEFETRVQASLNSSDKTAEMFIAYDLNDELAELINYDGQKRTRKIYRYRENSLYTIEDGKCKVTKVNESTSITDTFFGIILTPQGLSMKPPTDVLFFNNGVPHKNMGETTWRGIPVTRYFSCQTIGTNNFAVNYYIKSASFPVGVVFDEKYNRIPIAATVEGVLSGTAFKNEYNYFEFRTVIEKRSDLYQLPPRIYCEGQTHKETLPKIPNVFAFTEEAIYSGNRTGATTLRIHYNYDDKMVRFDTSKVPLIPDGDKIDTFKIVHDFNSGVVYIIDKVLGTCQFSTIGQPGFDLDAISLTSDAASALTLKNPSQMFFLDDTYFFAGQRIERGIPCNVWISNRTDVKFPVPDPPAYWTVEILFMSFLVEDESSGSSVHEPPAAIKITDPDFKHRFSIQIFDFDSAFPSPRWFDVSSCFESKDKREFGIRFRLPPNISHTTFQELFQRDTQLAFYGPLKAALSIYNLSPIRIMPPVLQIREDRITIFSGITATAPSMHQFKRLDDTRIDPNKAFVKVSSNSPDACADYCLELSTFNSAVYRCLSFDFCPNGLNGLCSFYNASHVTDPSVVLQSGTSCQHFSKVVDDIDAVKPELAYNAIKNAVINKDFKIQMQDKDGHGAFTLEAYDIYPGSLEANSGGALTNTTIQQNAFFERFKQYKDEVDFNSTEIAKNPSLFLRTRKDVSAEDCARLCARESTFDCKSMSYEAALADCKWSSLSIDEVGSIQDSPLITPKPGYTWFYRDILYDFIEFPFKVTSTTDYKVVEVDSASQCAALCQKETEIKCLSFNLCDNKDKNNYKCLISDKNIHSTEKNSSLTYSPLCTHFSRKALSEFKLYPQTQLGVTPKTKVQRSSVEGCALLCAFDDSFLCRSFDFFTETEECYLYRENIVDKSKIDLKIKNNPKCSHYSREYMMENGEVIKVNPLEFKTKKYSGGAIFGIVFALIVGGVVIGGLMAYGYNKYVKKTNMLPVMTFKNQNFDTK